MADHKLPQLANAFRLGRLVEELASINRKKIALQLLQNENHPIRDQKILAPAPYEIETVEQSLKALYSGNEAYLPKRLISLLKELDQDGESGLGCMNSRELSLVHSALSGLIEESMIHGFTWHALQSGRMSQRVWLLMHTILDGMSDHKMPSDILLRYLTFRSESPYVDFEGGTYLWVIHQVFSNLLKEKTNPRSAESTFGRLSLYIESFPVHQRIKKDYDDMSMALNRLSNDLNFLDVHAMIGDDPIDNFNNIDQFFQRQLTELGRLMAMIDGYLLVFEKFILELDEDEFFEFIP